MSGVRSMLSHARIRQTTVGLLILAAMVAGCTRAPGSVGPTERPGIVAASEEPSSPIVKVPPSGSVPPTSSPNTGSKCLQVSTAVNAGPETLNQLAMFASDVVVGTFDGLGEAQWNTADGQPPASDSELSVLVFRPIKITPTTALRGSMSSVASARIEGGDIGCNYQHFDNELDLKPGGTYTFFLVPEWDAKHARSTDPWVLWAWPTSADGTVTSPTEGDISTSDLSKTLAENPATGLPTPTP
jgi:hypothetical protein